MTGIVLIKEVPFFQGCSYQGVPLFVNVNLCLHFYNMYCYPVCDCNVDGSILATNGLSLCAKDTGECLCRPGATGGQCEGCMVSARI